MRKLLGMPSWLSVLTLVFCEDLCGSAKPSSMNLLQRWLLSAYWRLWMRSLHLLGVWPQKNAPASITSTPGAVINFDEGKANEQYSKR